jgi:hypothetical protein
VRLRRGSGAEGAKSQPFSQILDSLARRTKALGMKRNLPDYQHYSRDRHSAPSGFVRRDFLKLVGAGAALAFHPWQFSMAGPFTRADFDKLVPEDKKLTPEWVKSLTARGQREVYRGSDLAKIGMPIGGICAGQLYLGGDGKLWHWDLFNTRIGTGAEHYAKPLEPTSPLEQGFALRIMIDGKVQDRRWIGSIGATFPSLANTRLVMLNTRILLCHSL